MDLGRQSDEQAVLHDSGDAVQFIRESRTEGAIQNVVAIFGDEVAPLKLHTDAPRGGLPAERDYFHRQRCCSQVVDDLGVVDHHQESRAGLRYDLFPQQGPAASLDEVQGASLNLVGSVDGDVDWPSQFSKGNPQLASARRGAFGGGYARDPQALPDPT